MSATSYDSVDLAIIGGGIVGLSTAMECARRRPGARVLVLEKEAAVGAHQSSHNSGVIHSGIYYKPGSYKARFARKTAARTLDQAMADAWRWQRTLGAGPK